MHDLGRAARLDPSLNGVPARVIPVGLWHTASVGIDGVAKAFADLANPEAHTKIIVEPWR